MQFPLCYVYAALGTSLTFTRLLFILIGQPPILIFSFST